MKIYYIKLRKNELSDFIRFSRTYAIAIYFTWVENDFFDSNYFVTCTDEETPKVSTEEKARLISETYSTKIIKIENL